MATNGANSKPEELREGDSGGFGGSASGFTAVNGHASASPPEKQKSISEQAKEPSEGSSYRAIQPNDQQDRASTPQSRPPRPESQLVDHRPSPAPNPTVDRPYPAPPHPQGPAEEPRAPSVNGQSRHNSIHQPNTVNTSPQKRKRSDSDEYNNVDTSAFHSHPLPPPPTPQEQHRMYGMENGRPRESEPTSPHQPYPRQNPRDPYGRPEHGPPHGSYPQPDRHRLVGNEHEYNGDPHLAPAQQRQPYYPDPRDARLADVLTRENHGYEQPLPGRENFVTPEEEDSYPNEYATNRTAAQMEIDRKRRKRVFSNRTKTGCMTCRRRKKKCDEMHPECTFNSRLPLLPDSVVTNKLQVIIAFVAGSYVKDIQ